MSSLFKHSFQSKQSKEFIELALKAIPTLNRDAAKVIYKSIKHGNNEQWSSLEIALNALEKKSKFNIQIVQYEKIINDKTKNTLREVQSAKQQLTKLTINPQTAQLLRQIERGFNLETGSLTPKTALLPKNRNIKPYRSCKQRSRSVSNNNGLVPINGAPKASDSYRRRSKSNSRNPLNHTRSTTFSNNSVNDPTLSDDEECDDDDDDDDDEDSDDEEDKNDIEITQKKPIRKLSKDKQRSMSAMTINAIKGTQQSVKNGALPSMNTKEYLQFLLERAVTNKAWNDNDADRLCKCAISMKCDWITVHSMWVNKCHELLLRYTLKKYKTELKKHKKSKRRGSKISFPNAEEFKEYKDEKDIKSNSKICVIIGYPLGQTSTVSKVAEAKQAIQDGAKRTRLMISAGKVIMEDWDYIINEVKLVVGAANGADVRIVFPDTPQITEDVKHTFNQRIMQGMASKKEKDNNITPGDAEKEGVKENNKRIRPKLKCSFSDDSDSSSDENEEDNDSKSAEPGSVGSVKHKKRKKKKKNKKDKQRRASTMSAYRKKKKKKKKKKTVRFSKKEESDTSDDDDESSTISPSKSKSNSKSKSKTKHFHDDDSDYSDDDEPKSNPKITISQSEMVKDNMNKNNNNNTIKSRTKTKSYNNMSDDDDDDDDDNDNKSEPDPKPTVSLQQKKKTKPDKKDKKPRRSSTMSAFKKKDKDKLIKNKRFTKKIDDTESDSDDSSISPKSRSKDEDLDDTESDSDDLIITPKTKHRKNRKKKKSSSINMIDQSMTESVDIEPGAVPAVDSIKKEKKKKRRRKSKASKVFNDNDNEEDDGDHKHHKKKKKKRRKKKSKEDKKNDDTKKEHKKRRKKKSHKKGKHSKKSDKNEDNEEGEMKNKKSSNVDKYKRNKSKGSLRTKSVGNIRTKSAMY